MEQFLYANKDEQVKVINKYLATSMVLFDALIMLVVTISVMEGNRTLLYGVGMATVMIATCLTCFIMNKKDPASSESAVLTKTARVWTTP